MTPEAIRTYYDYSYWAFDRVWSCIEALDDEQFSQPIAFSMGSISSHVVHLMSATRRWITRIEGWQIPAHLPFEEYVTKTVAKAKWDELKAEALDYIYGLDQARLDEVVHWEIPARNLQYQNRRWEILLHVANHATDHRTQILTLLNHHFGVETVEHDMIFYLLGTTRE